ncbi:MAG: hypothetical protein IIA87_02460 [Nanoarchaeota archaeon]|nr:hypothetical protein [Nanoarchaeota archaeon]
MKLNNKKELAVRTLGIGKDRILFNKERLEEIKEAITKQDIRDLVKDKAIIIKEIKGSKKRKKRKTRRRKGSIKKKVKTRKRDYMIITRKLRAYALELKKRGALGLEEYRKIRKEIRAKEFRSKAHMKESISSLLKDNKQ